MRLSPGAARLGIVASLGFLTALAPISPPIEAKVAASATVQPNGPRGGNSGKQFLNVEGKNNGKESAYASFAVIDFRVENPPKPVAKVAVVSLTLVQSVARFSKDGPIKIYVTGDVKTSTEPEKSPLKFDPKTAGGVGAQLKPMYLLGPATFAKGKTGDPQTIKLTAKGEAEGYLRERINTDKTVRLVLVPDDDDMAATYFGAAHESPEYRPRLVFEVE